jgi:hypothetical protein
MVAINPIKIIMVSGGGKSRVNGVEKMMISFRYSFIHGIPLGAISSEIVSVVVESFTLSWKLHDNLVIGFLIKKFKSRINLWEPRWSFKLNLRIDDSIEVPDKTKTI